MTSVRRAGGTRARVRGVAVVLESVKEGYKGCVGGDGSSSDSGSSSGSGSSSSSDGSGSSSDSGSSSSSSSSSSGSGGECQIPITDLSYDLLHVGAPDTVRHLGFEEYGQQEKVQGFISARVGDLPSECTRLYLKMQIGNASTTVFIGSQGGTFTERLDVDSFACATVPLKASIIRALGSTGGCDIDLSNCHVEDTYQMPGKLEFVAPGDPKPDPWPADPCCNEPMPALTGRTFRHIKTGTDVSGADWNPGDQSIHVVEFDWVTTPGFAGIIAEWTGEEISTGGSYTPSGLSGGIGALNDPVAPYAGWIDEDTPINPNTVADSHKRLTLVIGVDDLQQEAFPDAAVLQHNGNTGIRVAAVDYCGNQGPWTDLFDCPRHGAPFDEDAGDEQPQWPDGSFVYLHPPEGFRVSKWTS